jgi:hypothetical protein
MTNTNNHETWAQLLHSAVHTPGKLLAAYTAFHNYSFLCLPQHSNEYL